MACVLPNMEFRILNINTSERDTYHSQYASEYVALKENENESGVNEA